MCADLPKSGDQGNDQYQPCNSGEDKDQMRVNREFFLKQIGSYAIIQSDKKKRQNPFPAVFQGEAGNRGGHLQHPHTGGRDNKGENKNDDHQGIDRILLDRTNYRWRKIHQDHEQNRSHQQGMECNRDDVGQTFAHLQFFSKSGHRNTQLLSVFGHGSSGNVVTF